MCYIPVIVAGCNTCSISAAVLYQVRSTTYNVRSIKIRTTSIGRPKACGTAAAAELSERSIIHWYNNKRQSVSSPRRYHHSSSLSITGCALSLLVRKVRPPSVRRDQARTHFDACRGWTPRPAELPPARHAVYICRHLVRGYA